MLYDPSLKYAIFSASLLPCGGLPTESSEVVNLLKVVIGPTIAAAVAVILWYKESRRKERERHDDDAKIANRYRIALKSSIDRFAKRLEEYDLQLESIQNSFHADTTQADIKKIGHSTPLKERLTAPKIWEFSDNQLKALLDVASKGTDGVDALAKLDDIKEDLSSLSLEVERVTSNFHIGADFDTLYGEMAGLRNSLTPISEKLNGLSRILTGVAT